MLKKYKYATKLNKIDKTIISGFEVVLDGIAKAIGSNCEVVLHSLEDPSHSVVNIVNGHITGRKVGAPLTDYAIEILDRAELLETDVIGSYYTKLDDGRLLKSITMLIRNIRVKPIGLPCINSVSILNLSTFLLDIIREFLPSKDELPRGKTVGSFPAGKQF